MRALQRSEDLHKTDNVEYTETSKAPCLKIPVSRAIDRTAENQEVWLMTDERWTMNRHLWVFIYGYWIATLLCSFCDFRWWCIASDVSTSVSTRLAFFLFFFLSSACIAPSPSCANGSEGGGAFSTRELRWVSVPRYLRTVVPWLYPSMIDSSIILLSLLWGDGPLSWALVPKISKESLVGGPALMLISMARLIWSVSPMGIKVRVRRWTATFHR